MSCRAVSSRGEASPFSLPVKEIFPSRSGDKEALQEPRWSSVVNYISSISLGPNQITRRMKSNRGQADHSCRSGGEGGGVRQSGEAPGTAREGVKHSGEEGKGFGLRNRALNWEEDEQAKTKETEGAGRGRGGPSRNNERGSETFAPPQSARHTAEEGILLTKPFLRYIFPPRLGRRSERSACRTSRWRLSTADFVSTITSFCKLLHSPSRHAGITRSVFSGNRRDLINTNRMNRTEP